MTKEWFNLVYVVALIATGIIGMGVGSKQTQLEAGISVLFFIIAVGWAAYILDGYLRRLVSSTKK